jgi:hypothetical protein
MKKTQKNAEITGKRRAVPIFGSSACGYAASVFAGQVLFKQGRAV